MANQFSFMLQDACSLIMEEMTYFHDSALMVLIFILSLIVYMGVTMCFNKITNHNLLFNEGLETMWTVLPVLVLVGLAFPSLKALYLMEDWISPELSVKILGHQWFWSYEYGDFSNVEFDSYMKNSNDLNNNDFRLLDVDNRMVIPINVGIRGAITSTDVIHSWTIPSMGVKMDANPGRINQIFLSSNRIGLFYGQCSEICGVMHSFMPICVEVTSLPSFKEWVYSFN